MIKAFLFSGMLILMGQCSIAQGYYKLVDEAYSNYQNKEYSVSLKLYESAFKISKNDAGDIYNAACSAALSGKTKTSVHLLKSCIKYGFNDMKHLQEDSDLISLRSLKNWNKIYVQLLLENKKVEGGYNKSLALELTSILRSDQDTRSAYLDYIKKNAYKSKGADSLRNIIFHADSINQIKVVDILNKYGWVGNKEVGANAGIALFAVIQHADLSIQKKYLPLLEKAAKNGDAKPSWFALLQDRVLVREGKEQIYGTQIGTDNNGKHFLQPISDPTNVDKRRTDIGLGPLKDYLNQWNITEDH